MWYYVVFFMFKNTATTKIYTYLHTLSLHDALPICLSLPIRTTSKSEPADCAVAGEARAAPLSYAPTLQTTRVMTQFTRIAILGATGRMGQAVAAAVAASPQLVLGAAVARAGHADLGKPIAGPADRKSVV